MTPDWELHYTKLEFYRVKLRVSCRCVAWFRGACRGSEGGQAAFADSLIATIDARTGYLTLVSIQPATGSRFISKAQRLIQSTER
jgi:hypothetical protein